jgi:hypothetical protein
MTMSYAGLKEEKNIADISPKGIMTNTLKHF